MDDSLPFTDPGPSAAGDRTEQFVALLLRHQPEIHTFILTLLPNWADADDIFQRTSIVLWKKFAEWQPNTSFAAWACQVARFEIKNFRRSQARDRLNFDAALLDTLGDVRLEMAASMPARHDALQRCLQKLPADDRELVGRCYPVDDVLAKDVAVQMGKPVNTVYKALIRIRRRLLACIERTLAAEERSS